MPLVAERISQHAALTFLCFIVPASLAWGQENAATDRRSLQPGHSVHAEAFDDGPRQSAYLMGGMGNVHWEISTKNPLAQRFFDQGIVQLHGFWYFEAERSFRQAAAFDPECAMFYWGMARANIENPLRSKGFIEQAMKRIASCTDKEKRLVEAWNKRVKDVAVEPSEPKPDKRALSDKERKAAARAKRREADKRRDDQKEILKQYANDLEGIASDFPEDIEIKAMLVLQYWQNDGQGIPLQSQIAINGLLSEIFQTNPKHPAHHFRIHLWDYRKEKLAVDAAAKCGPAAPGIAHMWHMPGHTYSRLNRYADAAWQQEASARVDHAHMMRDGVMPDQIHNFAHNNEWLIRNLILLGRVSAAKDLAKNMIELPRHPKYNAPDGRGSAALGRDRLLNVLTQYRAWQDLLSMVDSPYLDPAGDVLKQDENQAWKGIAHSQLGDVNKANEIVEAMQQEINRLQSHCIVEREVVRQLQEKEESSKDNGSAKRPPELLLPYELSMEPFGDENDPSIEPTPSKEISDSEMAGWSSERQEKSIELRESEYRVAKLKQLVFAIKAYVAQAQGDYKAALRVSNHARNVINSTVRMEWLAQAGFADKALQRIEQRIADGPNEFLPLATGVWIASLNDLDNPEIKEKAKKMLVSLSPIAASADSDLAVLGRIQPAIEKLDFKEQWRKKPSEPTDVGDRPDLDSLGPFRWSPRNAPVWTASNSEGELRSSKHFGKRPLVLILYLGFGCLHCAEQLRDFSPMVEQYQAAGIDVAAISSESLSQLQSGLRKYDSPMKLPLMANPELDIFKSFRCFDDFEGQPLHGTFLIDTNGKIRWQDTGAEPFMEPKFLLDEAVRLLKL